MGHHCNHDHAHSHHHTPTESQINRPFAIAVILNLLFVAVEAFYGWKVNSLALLADAGHNLSDVAGLLLAWAGAVAGKLKPNPHNTYGWQRSSILAAFINSVVLLVAMGALCWEAIERLWSHPTTHGMTIIVVATIGILLNTATALLFMKGSKDDLNIRGAFLHMLADAAVSGGVVVSGALFLAFGWDWLDPIASILIAFVIVIGTLGLFRQSLHMLFDGVPPHIDPLAVRNHLQTIQGVAKIHDLHIWPMSTSETALTVHLVMPDGHPGDSFILEINKQIFDLFKISHTTIQIEEVEILHEQWATHV